MFSVRSALLSSVCLLALTEGAMAQPRSSQNVTAIPERLPTYAAGIVALTPVASATDFFTITGSATQTIRIKSISCVNNSTAAGAVPITLVRRSSANTGGTSTARPALQYDTSDAVATAVVSAYTANPATLGTLVASSVMDTQMLYSAPVSAGAIAAPVFGWNFGNQEDKEPTLRGVGQVLALNANAATFPAGSSISCSVRWFESTN